MPATGVCDARRWRWRRSYNKGTPTRSIYHFKLLVALVEEIGFHLAQELFWYNPAKMPARAEWVDYDGARGKVAVTFNARLVGEKALYREKLGQHFFNDTNCFPGTKKYTLEPLREYGAEALPCGDVEGIESITLTEIDLLWGGTHREIEVAEDSAEQQRGVHSGQRRRSDRAMARTAGIHRS